ncbi:MAG: 2-oxoacid:acceptor oxidoreductase subunit alpha [Candidatus Aminicenantes bacterium]|nr:2-oxoacid:acceptor oxidoreductase subunit alpha [Candidatus Aminicenantes bacterium]
MKRDDVSIVLCGAAGQGIQTVEHILVRLLRRAGYHVFATKEYMSRIRGGSNSTQIRVSGRRVAAPSDRIDILLPFHDKALRHLKSRIVPETTIVGDRKNICKDCPAEAMTFLDAPFAEIADEVGGKIFINIIAAGTLLGMLAVDFKLVRGFIRKYFANKGEPIIGKNLAAVERGYVIGKGILESGQINIPTELTQSDDNISKKEILVNGAEAVGLGALAGGCNFLSSYPMSPSTGIMVFLSQQAGNCDIVVEQAEDEIAAINMALGASYAGARAMVTTSGGGFALMTEGVSLAGMIETPVVIHLAQRPGPATGLPTRTEQGDLDLVLYAGHGEFPRIVFAPGSLEEAFFLTHKAFHLADKFQVPVFILTDQYMMDTFYNVSPFDLKEVNAAKHIVRTVRDYKRFALTENGLSPRGIPGFGLGFVGVDSDEHDEESHITEDLDLRTKMVDKRLKKLDSIKEDIIPPELIGAQGYHSLIIGWGSTLHAIKEALRILSRDDVAFFHFKQVYPVHHETGAYLKKAARTILVENNATSQFGRLIRLETGFAVDEKVLKYNGLAFTAEELVSRFKEMID